MSADSLARIDTLDGFFEQQFAYYLHEHQHPLNRRTHMVGIPLLLVTLVWAVMAWDWRILVAGQVVGWTIQIWGHRIEGNRPALLKRPISFLMGPMMVLIEMLEGVGLHFEFAQRARAAVKG